MSGRAVILLTVCFSAIFACAQASDPFPDIDGHHGILQNAQFGSVSGVVSGSDGAPVADARIELRDEQTGRAMATGYTNSAGAFAFNNLPFAAYDLIASHGLSEAH